MKHFVQHMIRQHLDEIASKSLYNCHVPGLASILFVDAPEQRIRLFIATRQHELWRNNPTTLGSLAAHAHHCDITLECVFGRFANLSYAAYEAGPETGGPFHAYHYTSGIFNPRGKFEASHLPGVAYRDYDYVHAGESLALPAHQIHSVQVNKGVVAAWFVYEGKEDAGYESLSYSDQNLALTSFDNLYRPMNTVQVVELLETVNLL